MRGMSIAGSLLMAWALACGADEKLPPNLSREPNCIEGTYCMKAGERFIPSELPAGFSRMPDCVAHTICVSESLLMLEADFLAIRDLVLSGIPKDSWEITEIKDVMRGMVVVTAQTRDRGFSWGAGERLLLEKQDKGWVVTRRQQWVV